MKKICILLIVLVFASYIKYDGNSDPKMLSDSVRSSELAIQENKDLKILAPVTYKNRGNNFFINATNRATVINKIEELNETVLVLSVKQIVGASKAPANIDTADIFVTLKRISNDDNGFEGQSLANKLTGTWQWVSTMEKGEFVELDECKLKTTLTFKLDKLTITSNYKNSEEICSSQVFESIYALEDNAIVVFNDGKEGQEDRDVKTI